MTPPAPCPHLSAPCPSLEPWFSFLDPDVTASGSLLYFSLKLSVYVAVRHCSWLLTRLNARGLRANRKNQHVALKAVMVTANWSRAISAHRMPYLCSHFLPVSPHTFSVSHILWRLCGSSFLFLEWDVSLCKTSAQLPQTFHSITSSQPTCPSFIPLHHCAS